MSIGRDLKEARNKKKLKINDIYAQTKIHHNVLRALESDDYKTILSPAYIRSFLKEYAAFLGMDVKAVLAEYDKINIVKIRKISIQQNNAKKISGFKAPKPILKTIIKALKWVIILFLAITVIKTAIGHIAARKNLSRNKEKAAMARPKPVNETLKKSAAIPQGKKIVLTLQTMDDAWLKIKVDKKIIFEGTLKKGSIESWTANDSFNIWTGKAHAIRITLNGKDLGVAGKGVVKNLIIDREGIKK